jgi:hypothetical protein
LVLEGRQFDTEADSKSESVATFWKNVFKSTLTPHLSFARHSLEKNDLLQIDL